MGNTTAPACPYVTNLMAKVISCVKLSCDQIPHKIGDKLSNYAEIITSDVLLMQVLH